MRRRSKGGKRNFKRKLKAQKKRDRNINSFATARGGIRV